jgi:hypothetical protein
MAAREIPLLLPLPAEPSLSVSAEPRCRFIYEPRLGESPLRFIGCDVAGGGGGEGEGREKMKTAAGALPGPSRLWHELKGQIWPREKSMTLGRRKCQMMIERWRRRRRSQSASTVEGGWRRKGLGATDSPLPL